ncbi:hypothetical protein GCM10010965_14290 [Caldalkalibacillus thermarum]|uniref:hypothetical protein n=1 Tax=Caldalkalibacillus thermarum TaxID=296745 RepID=UPI00166E27CD|nr:hypothetical protein [Caldalkalibacillus thermarum]GGK22515.1 hypothetical protein GCM10010965_14290 [Caldalkalibacillus thermarum]
MFELKANLFFGGSTAELIRQAVQAYKDRIKEMDCPHCGRKMKIDFFEEVMYADVGDQRVEILVTNIPKHVCHPCERMVENLKLMVAIEEEVDRIIRDCLRNKKAFPKQIDFLDLIGMGKADLVPTQ